MEQGIVELEDVIARYGMFKVCLVVVVVCHRTPRDLTINTENVLLLLDFPMTEE